MKISERVIELKSTKEIIERMVANCELYSDFKYSIIFKGENGMFKCVSNNDGDTIYEVKITRKKPVGDARIQEDDVSINKDKIKADFLAHLFPFVKVAFKKVAFHKGDILIHDDNNDYVINLVKKIGLEW